PRLQHVQQRIHVCSFEVTDIPSISGKVPGILLDVLHPPTCKQLKLGRELSEDAWRAATSFLSHLEEAELDFAEVSAVSLQALEALTTAHRLQDLNISSVSSIQQGIDTLMRVLSLCTQLHTLHISDTGMDATTSARLIYTACRLPRLTKLYFSASDLN